MEGRVWKICFSDLLARLEMMANLWVAGLLTFQRLSCKSGLVHSCPHRVFSISPHAGTLSISKRCLSWSSVLFAGFLFTTLNSFPLLFFFFCSTSVFHSPAPPQIERAKIFPMFDGNTVLKTSSHNSYYRDVTFICVFTLCILAALSASCFWVENK